MEYQGGLFARRKFDPAKARAYGFVKSEAGYVYSATLMDSMFDLTVTIAKAKRGRGERIDTLVVDAASKEEYILLGVKNASGEFVGQVREQYHAILADISAKCFRQEIFKTPYAKKIIRHIEDAYGVEAEFLWEKFPSNAVFRDKANNKWFAAILTVAKDKVGLAGDGECEIIDLKASPAAIASLVDNISYLPGFHMNKKHWYTIRLDGSVPIAEIYRRIASSYAMVKKA